MIPEDLHPEVRRTIASLSSVEVFPESADIVEVMTSSVVSGITQASFIREYSGANQPRDAAWNLIFSNLSRDLYQRVGEAALLRLVHCMFRRRADPGFNVGPLRRWISWGMSQIQDFWRNAGRQAGKTSSFSKRTTRGEPGKSPSKQNGSVYGVVLTAGR